MHTLTFKNDKNKTLSKLVAFASSHPRKKPYEKGTTEDLGVWLVKDEGSYVMSPTDLNFCISKKDKNTVVYARGYRPTKANGDALWYKSHEVSGDDFAEFVPLIQEQADRIVNQNGDLIIRFSETQLCIEA